MTWLGAGAGILYSGLDKFAWMKKNTVYCFCLSLTIYFPLSGHFLKCWNFKIHTRTTYSRLPHIHMTPIRYCLGLGRVATATVVVMLMMFMTLMMSMMFMMSIVTTSIVTTSIVTTCIVTAVWHHRRRCHLRWRTLMCGYFRAVHLFANATMWRTGCGYIIPVGPDCCWWWPPPRV